jgi:membrane fusion protein (multidrug efflux system)
MRSVAVLAIGMSACRDPKAAAPPPPPAVVVAPVVQKDVPIYSEWIGTTDGDVNAQIRPKVDGYLRRRVYAEGSTVRRGEILFEIDPRQTQAAMQQARASLEQARAALAKAQRDVERAQPLAEQRALSQQELDNALSAQRAAQAAVAAGQATVDQAQLNLSWAVVTSPIAGVAGLALAQVGDLVGPQTILTTVSTVDPIRVLFRISEQEYLKHEPRGAKDGGSDALEMILADGTVFPHRGRWLFAAREVDVRTGAIAMVGAFPNPGNRLRPGQYAKVRAQTALKKGALLVPQRAVNELQGAYQIAVIGPDNKADVRTVKPAERIDNLWVIDEGLHPGERVVVEGFSRVKAGTAVAPKDAGAEPGK